MTDPHTPYQVPHVPTQPQPSQYEMSPPPKERRRWPRIAGAVAAVVLAGGAGAGAMYLTGSQPTNPNPAADATLPASTGSPTTSALPVTPSAADVAHRLGQTVAVAGLVDATVHAYRQPVPSRNKPEQPGHVWSAAEVSVCVRAGVELQIIIDEGPWSLVYADGSSYEPSDLRYGDHPRPEFPVIAEKVTQPGRCVRGWIVFGVPADKRPQYIEYAPQTARTPMDWTP